MKSSQVAFANFSNFPPVAASIFSICQVHQRSRPVTPQDIVNGPADITAVNGYVMDGPRWRLEVKSNQLF
jgi:hypothetical protein